MSKIADLVRDYRVRRLARQVKRYAAGGLSENAANLLKVMGPKAFRANGGGADLTPRVVAADAFDDMGRNDEANLLRDTTNHLYLDEQGIHDANDILQERIAQARRPGHGLAADLPSDDRRYLDGALRRSVDFVAPGEGGGPPITHEHTAHDIHPATMAAMLADFRHFKHENEQNLWVPRFHHPNSHDFDEAYDFENRAPRQFWNTRNENPGGFASNSDYWGDENARALNAAARQYGDYQLYVGDDGMIHGTYEVPDEPFDRPPSHAPYDRPPPDDDDEGEGGSLRAQDRQAERDFRNHRMARSVKRYAEMQHSQEEESLHRAMEANPEDRTNPLVYADWLEENGRSGEAAVIRSHISRYDLMEKHRVDNGLLSHAPVNINPFPSRRAFDLHATRYPGVTDNDDLVSINFPLLHNPNKNVRFSGWFPREESTNVVRNLLASGFTHNQHFNDQREMESIQMIHPLPERPYDPEQLSRLARAVRRYAQPQRINTSINGKPYSFVKNDQGWGVVSTESATDKFHRSYQVTCDENGNPVKCTCPDNFYRGGVCKHMKAVAGFAKESAGQNVQPTEEPKQEPSADDQNKAKQMARRFAAYRAPAGGIAVRGTFYQGGKLIPDLQKFMTPERKSEIAKRLKKPKKVKQALQPGPYDPGPPDMGPMVVSYARAVRRYAQMGGDMTALFNAAHQDPRNETIHGVIADAIEEGHPGSPFPEMIRSLYPTLSGSDRNDAILGSGGDRPQNTENLWHHPFESGRYANWHPYTAHLGSHGPFELYLGHESVASRDPTAVSLQGLIRAGNPIAREVYRDWREENRGQHHNDDRWTLHAVAQVAPGHHAAYTFEFPDAFAGDIAKLLGRNATMPHIDDYGHARDWAFRNGSDPKRFRDMEAARFEIEMDRQQEARDAELARDNAQDVYLDPDGHARYLG